MTIFKVGDFSENNIEYWLLEINENGRINREVSIGDNGQIISIAPFRSNRGLWVDSMVSINSEDYESITAKEFLDCWESATQAP